MYRMDSIHHASQHAMGLRPKVQDHDDEASISYGQLHILGQALESNAAPFLVSPRSPFRCPFRCIALFPSCSPKPGSVEVVGVIPLPKLIKVLQTLLRCRLSDKNPINVGQAHRYFPVWKSQWKESTYGGIHTGHSVKCMELHNTIQTIYWQRCLSWCSSEKCRSI